MKILQIGPLPPPQGGIATYIKSLYEMFCHDPDIELHIYNTSKGHHRSYKKIIENIKKIIQYPNLVLKFSPQIIHAHLATGKGFWQIVIYIVITKLIMPTKPKIIGHLHGAEFESNYYKSNNFKKQLYRFVLKKYFDVFICLSKKWYNFYSTIIDKNKLVILYNFYDINKEPRELDLQNKNKKERIDYLFLANLIPRKGISELLFAFENALKKSVNKNFYLHIIGDGQEMDKITKFTNNSIYKNHIYIYGALCGEEKLKIMKKCDFFILPSYNEGLPIALLESMFLGLCPIVTSVGAISELITNEQNGFFIEPGNITNIENKIIYSKNIYEQDFLRYKEIILENHRLATTRYSKEIIYNELRKLYLSLEKEAGGKDGK